MVRPSKYPAVLSFRTLLSERLGIEHASANNFSDNLLVGENQCFLNPR